ncbi:mobilization protein [Acinetobacter baumannii]
MHIKFLAHGTGSAAKASAYVLDKLDHLGNVRAGVEVLRGDATTFNAICDASPHLWKYTSGVIAWSKEDDPTDTQIQEVLNDFEQHAFAGLDPSQYHLFAVLHTDQDGSKHIHILTPRIDIESGKSLNIAPPGHEKYFDSLRDYFNTKYQWSRPDDLLLMRTTQEPNHIVKLNAQAKKILSSQELENLPKKQFCQAMDNYVQTLLKTQTAENRADIVACLKQLDGIDSIKPSKDFLTVTLSSGKKHRLKGDFYNEKFEIGSYSEHLRAAAENRATANELAAALTDADQLRATYRAKRATYHQQHHAFTQRTADDNSPRAASTLDFDRDKESITPSNTNAHNELYGANTSIKSTAIEYRYIEHQNRHNEHRFIFNINSGSTDQNQQPVAEHLDRPTEFTTEHTITSTASDSKPKRADRERNTNADHRKTEYAKSKIHFMRDDLVWTADLFNSFLSGLSSPYKLEDNRSATTNYSTELRSNHGPNRIFEDTTEVSHADRNRPIFDRAKRLVDSTKQLVSRTKRSLESTGQFIKKYFDHLQRSRAEFKGQNQQLELREKSSTSLDFGHEIRTFKARTGQLIGAVTASISKQCADPITDAINTSFEAAGFKQHCQQLSKHSIETHSIEYQLTASRPRERTLENLATESTRQLLRRFRDAEQANRHARGDSRKINRINQQLGQLEKIAAEIRLMPKPATDFQFSSLRNDNYYHDYVLYHKELCDKQQQAYDSKKLSLLIDYTKKKAENLETYMSRASRKLNKSDYNKIEQIIQNDQRMLKYRQCEKILEPQNSHFEQQRETYQTCLKHFENIKSDIEQIKNPSSQHNVSQNSYEPEYKAKPQNDLDFNF